MPKISSLTPLNSPDDDDLIVIVDDSSTETRKMPISTLGNNGEWVKEGAIGANEITAKKIGLSYCTLKNTGFQTLSNLSWTKVNFDTSTADTESYWSSGTPSRITLPTDGWYRTDIWIVWGVSGAGTLRATRIEFNNSVGDERDISAYDTPVPYNNKNYIGLEFYAVAGDYFDVWAYQNSGGNLNIEYADDYNSATKLSVRKISEF